MSGSLNRRVGHMALPTLAQSITKKEQDKVGKAGPWESARPSGQSASQTGQPEPGTHSQMAALLKGGWVLGRATTGLPSLRGYPLSQH